MKALVKTKHGKGNIRIEERPIPAPESQDDVLIRVRYAGVCGTDLKIYQDETWYAPPVILGHEFSGVVEKVGSNVKGIEVGAEVVSETANVTCGHCEYCRTGKKLMCKERLSIGYGVDGAFADFIRVKSELVHVLPPGTDMKVAALAEPLSVAIHALYDKCDCLAGKRVAVFGPGTIGSLMTLLVRIAGGTPVLFGIEKDSARLNYIAEAFDVSAHVGEAALFAEFKGQFDIAVDCSGSAAAVRDALGLIKPTGMMIQVGLTKDEFVLPYAIFVQKELRLVGSFGHRWENWELAIKLLAQHGKLFSKIITYEAALDEWKEVFEKSISGVGLKYVFKF